MPEEKTIESLKKNYPPGTRVELVRMNDPHAPAVGCRGTVSRVDDIGTIHVVWDDGSTLGAVWDEDIIYKTID